MGFYREKPKKQGLGRGAAAWIGSVVLAAVVGSASTVGILTAVDKGALTIGNSTPAAVATASGAVSGSTTPSTPVSTVNVNETSAISTVAQQVEPAVMAVVNYQDQSSGFGQAPQLQPYGVGTGVYFYKDSHYAYAVTNNHVVQDAQKIEVVLKSGKQVQATLVGTDPYTDLAVIKIPVSNMSGVTPVTFANSDNLQAGQPAIAIGTPMGLDFAESVTSGIISSPKRVMPVENPDNNQVLDYQNVIQTDAAINPGNSGGPLLNIQGQVVGINSSKIVETDVQGMGFAIPSNEVVQIANEILKTGHAVHPALGIEEVSMDEVGAAYGFYGNINAPVNYGVLVESVDSPEAKASGLKPQDIIVALDGKTVANDADLRTYIFADKPGQTVTLTVYRGDKKLNLKLKLTTLQSVQSSTQGNSSPGGYGGYGSGQGQSGQDPLNPFGSFGN
ncbi:MAG: trypsin-like peptidase domain-containing protein [Alicyclobacillus sp.]|nr:trypsin-like peptidase domain-containing protein [Alicyclobacillus sp.]